MKKLWLLLLLGNLAWAKPALDLEQPGWTRGRLARANRTGLSAQECFALDCREVERMPYSEERARRFMELRQRSQAFGPGPARARFLWVCAALDNDKASALRLVRQVLSEPSLTPRFRVHCLRRSFYWAGSDEERAWLLAQARELSQERDEVVQVGWLEILGYDCQRRGMSDQARSLAGALLLLAEKNHWYEDQVLALRALHREVEAERLILSLAGGERRNELLAHYLPFCSDQATYQRFVQAFQKVDPIEVEMAGFYWWALPGRGKAAEAVRRGARLVAYYQAHGPVEQEVKARSILSRELERQGRLNEAEKQLQAICQLRADHPWPDPSLQNPPNWQFQRDRVSILRRQGRYHQALAVAREILPETSGWWRFATELDCLELARDIEDNELAQSHWESAQAAVDRLHEADRSSAYVQLLRSTPPDQKDRRAQLLRLAQESGAAQLAAAEGGQARYLAANQLERLYEQQDEKAAISEFWKRELARAQQRGDELMLERSQQKLLWSYSWRREAEAFKLLAEPLLKSPKTSQELRESALGSSCFLASLGDPQGLVWVDEWIRLLRRQKDPLRLVRGLKQRSYSLTDLGRYESAMRDLDEALKLAADSQRPEIVVAKARLLEKLERKQEAASRLSQEMTRQLSSQDPQALDELLRSFIWLAQGDWQRQAEQALVALERLGEAGAQPRDRALGAWLQNLGLQRRWQEGRDLLNRHPWKLPAGAWETARAREFKVWDDLLPSPPPAPVRPAVESSGVAAKVDELRLARPELGQWLSLRGTNLKRLQAHLGPHDSLVTYANWGEEVYVFVLRPGESSWSSRRVSLSEEVRGYLKELSRDRPGSAESNLYNTLLAPALHQDPEQRLLLVPTGTLWQVPFGALRDEKGESAASRAEIVLLTSGDLLRLADNSWQPYQLSAPLAIGAPPAADLPGAFAELEEVSQTLPGCQLRRGPEATLAALRQSDQPWGLVHFATHARYNRDRPTESNLQLSDGNLTLKQLSQLSLAEHSLVSLSCCQGGTSDRQDLEDPVTLATGFSAAGAETVVGHLWQVDDEAARLFFRSFYRELARGATPSRSFRRAQSDCRAAFPKPRDWAGFFLLGNPN